MAGQHDRGLRAVARVREVREKDSELGLRRASHEHQQLTARAGEIDAELDRHAAAAPGEIASQWVASRQVTLAVAAAASRAHADADTAGLVRTAAQEHWQGDRTRLRAVETLLERRAQTRHDERERRIAAELDDLAAQRWLRAHRGAGGAR